MARRLAPSAPVGNVLDKKVRYGSAFLEEIDWARTRAFFAQDKGVWVNLSGRESEGIVSESGYDDVVKEARDVIKSLTSQVDGQPVFERVMRRDEAFKGAWGGPPARPRDDPPARRVRL